MSQEVRSSIVLHGKISFLKYIKLSEECSRSSSWNLNDSSSRTTHMSLSEVSSKDETLKPSGLVLKISEIKLSIPNFFSLYRKGFSCQDQQMCTITVCVIVYFWCIVTKWRSDLFHTFHRSKKKCVTLSK